MSNISVIGTGYVGLVTGTTLAEIGHEVVCIDADKEKITLLKKGTSPIYEPGLEEMIINNFNKGLLHFETDLNFYARKSEVIYIAVGTPQNPNGSANLDFIWNVVHQLTECIDPNKKYTVVVKSTVPVGTNRKIKQFFFDKNMQNVSIVSNPEFLREGFALKDVFEGDRIIVGSDDQESFSQLKKIYSPLNLNIYHTTIESAELIKYASNAFLATKISFINEIANLAEVVGANITEVSKGMGLDHRIGNSFLKAGIGYGGSCFPKDTHALKYLADSHLIPLNLVNAAIETNRLQKLKLIDKFFDYFGQELPDTIAVLGLSFKPNTDDIREAASLSIIETILKETDICLNLYDPAAMSNTKEKFPESDRLRYKNSIDECITGTGAVLLLTEWAEFQYYPIVKYQQLMEDAVIFDGRNILNDLQLKKNGITHIGIGVSDDKQTRKVLSH
ncbi:UDP-glucose/GDP-mannose dehydrogenase family protein [Enterococcus faecium]|uniref:UDP-glucose dehydrogenase family protein n=1 Tax=Enterococcus faecium TaxID=1352 RepID=UPI000BF16791|nr:UDP-glucose/GDP-mannose dehydrogenase family protein [Enterococcus faecium]PEH49537.1 UDP-glucose 6-dehydrogenase [Enterococcus faecium]